MVPTRTVLRTAGCSSFYAGLVPVLRTFLSQLWAAVTAEARSTTGTLRVVRTRRFVHSIRWLVAFFEQAASPPGLAFSIPYKPKPTDFLCFIVDASPWGIGGVELIEGKCNRATKPCSKSQPASRGPCPPSRASPYWLPVDSGSPAPTWALECPYGPTPCPPSLPSPRKRHARPGWDLLWPSWR